MKITDINGKVREITSIKKILHHVVDVKSGNSVDVPYVEVMIVGKNSTWKEWWPLADFVKRNPNSVIT